VKKVAIYCVDQERSTTRSLGIYNYTRRLIRALAALPDPGVVIELWLTDSNSDEFLPLNPPSWMSVRTLRGSSGTGLRRLWADHVLAARLARESGADLVHYPKGWMPAIPPRNHKTVATMHDTIVQYYLRQACRPFSTLHLLYFDWAARHTLRCADAVIAPSQFSANELSRLVPEAAPRIRIVPEGGPAFWNVPDGPSERRGFLVIGSKLPHKATLETLRLLVAYGETSAHCEPVSVVGLAGRSDLPDMDVADTSDITFLGNVSDQELTTLMRTSRALIFLSHMEGFGLPALEAYSVHTPVCYRNSSSLAEVLAGAPGAWDGLSQKSFFHAMDAVLSLAPGVVRHISEQLGDRYNWAACAELTMQAYLDILSS
jgi:alpha-1,3-rhamnosyl/mannosyltransferase